MNNNIVLNQSQTRQVFKPIYEKADVYMTRVLFAHVAIALFLALFYNTWLLAIVVGSLSLAAWFGTKALVPNGSLHRYTASAFLGVYVGLYIYQMHGLFEMHFFAFISAAILIIYQDWKMQLPLILFIVVHHASFAYAQFAGIPDVYFTQLQYMDLQTFIFHAVLALAVVAVCGKWSHTFRKSTIGDAITKAQLRASNKKMGQMNLALNQITKQLKQENYELNKSNEKLSLSNDELMETTKKQIELNAKLANMDWNNQ